MFQWSIGDQTHSFDLAFAGGAMAAIGPLFGQMPGEDFTTRSLPEVASWIVIYEELGAVLLAVRSRLDGDGSGPADLPDHLDWVEERLAAWRKRHAELTGLAVHRPDHSLVYGGRKLKLTRREADLLDFMLQHPFRPFTARQLSTLAWHSSWLSDGQVRTYVMRLRHRLSQIGIDGVIQVERNRGYGVAASPAAKPAGLSDPPLRT